MSQSQCFNLSVRLPIVAFVPMLIGRVSKPPFPLLDAVLCELLCLELFTVFFQENRFRYKFFDIVQFSRSCQRLSRPADDLIILPQK